MLGKVRTPAPGAGDYAGCGRGPMRVLVVEDHAKLALAIAAVLRREGMAADVCFDGGAALAKAAVSPYDVVALARDLPGAPGDEGCHALAPTRADPRPPIATAPAP